MGKTCVIYGCKSKNYPDRGLLRGLTFHRAPKNPDILQKWVLAIGREDISKKYVCNKHFRKDDYKHGYNRAILKPDAVPSLLLKKYEPKLIQSPTDSSCEDSESETKNKRFGPKSEESILHSFSEKDGKITHIYENKLKGAIVHSFEEIDEDINVRVNNEEVVSDTDSIFDPPSIVNLKDQLQKEKERNGLCRDEIEKLIHNNSVLRARNLKCKRLLKCIMEKYIHKRRDPDGRIVFEFLHKIN